jgi:hypothetical protein
MSCGIFDPVQCVFDVVDTINDVSAEMFWQLATAPLTLVVIAGLAILAYAVAHVPFVEKFIPITAPFIRSAQIVCLACTAALIFLVGHRSADQRAELERARSDLAWTEFQLGEQTKSAADAAVLKTDADAKAQEARSKLSVYQAKFGQNPDGIPNAIACAPRAGVIDWVHDLQRRKQAAGAVTAKPKRGLVARLRRSGAERR